MKQNARDARTPWSLARPGQSESHVMKFCIADSFTNALGELPAQEQKAVKTSAFDLQMDPSAPGLSFHRIDRSKDPHFWTVRVNRDIRIVVHKTEASILLAGLLQKSLAAKPADPFAHPHTRRRFRIVEN